MTIKRYNLFSGITSDEPPEERRQKGVLYSLY